MWFMRMSILSRLMSLRTTTRSTVMCSAFGGSVYAGKDEPYLFGRLRVSGPDPEHGSYRSFASFRDPDGNGRLLQEVTMRLPGRGLSLDVATLTDLLRETEERHGQYEPTAPKHHWSGWYAAYIAARENGSTPDEAAKGAALHIEGGRDRASA